MTFPRRWMTAEEPPRRLTAKGVSGVDPDCLVAYLDGDDHPLWMVWNGDPRKETATVVGWPGDERRMVTAIRVETAS